MAIIQCVSIPKFPGSPGVSLVNILVDNFRLYVLNLSR